MQHGDALGAADLVLRQGQPTGGVLGLQRDAVPQLRSEDHHVGRQVRAGGTVNARPRDGTAKLRRAQEGGRKLKQRPGPINRHQPGTGGWLGRCRPGRGCLGGLRRRRCGPFRGGGLGRIVHQPTGHRLVQGYLLLGPAYPEYPPASGTADLALGEVRRQTQCLVASGALDPFVRHRRWSRKERRQM